jgi:hypothetical protein
MSIKIATIYGTTFLGLFKHRPSIYAGLGLLSPSQLLKKGLKEISRITDLIGAQKCDFSNILRDTFQIEVSLTGNEDGFVGRIISIAESRGGYWLTVLDGDAALVFIPFHSISTIRSY